MRAMFLHVLADTLGSIGMIISTVFVHWRAVSTLWKHQCMLFSHVHLHPRYNMRLTSGGRVFPWVHAGG